MVNREDKRRLAEAIGKALETKPGANRAEVSRLTLQALTADADNWIEMRDRIAAEYVNVAVGRALLRATAFSEWSQPWLPFPEYQHISIEVRDGTLGRYRERIVELEGRIKSYSYPRRSEKNLKRDKQEVREMKRLEPKIAPFFADDPAMTVERAAELYQKSLAKPAYRQRKMASRNRWSPQRRINNFRIT